MPTSAQQNLSILRVTFIYLMHYRFVANLTLWFAKQEAFRSAAYPILRILVCHKLPPLNAPLLHTDSLQAGIYCLALTRLMVFSLDFSLWWYYPAPSGFFFCFSFLGFRVLTSQGCCMDCLLQRNQPQISRPFRPFVWRTSINEINTIQSTLTSIIFFIT